MGKMNCIIVGAGPSGLSAAWKLAKLGHKVIIIEKDRVVGGNARTIWSNGFGFDYGPHNFHTPYLDILEFLKIIIGNNFLQHYIKSSIYFRKKWVPYPLTGFKVFTSIPLYLAVICFFDFLFTRLRKRIMRERIVIVSFEDWVVQNFGRRLFNIYFKPYATKVWGIQMDKLSKDVGEKRVPALSLWKLTLQVFGIVKSKHPEDPSTLNHYYPTHGIGVVCDQFRKEIEEQGGTFYFNTSVEKIQINGDRISSIFTSGKEIQCDLLLWTGPIPELIKLFRGAIDDNLIKLSEQLLYRSEHLLFLKINKKRVLPNPWVYFSSPEVPFTRIYETGIFSSQMVPDGKTGLCIEFTCQQDDEIWRASSEELFKIAFPHLENSGLLKAEEVSGYFSEKIEHAYPIYSVGYAENIATLFRKLQEFKNVLSFGRLGMFSYANVDEAIRMGFKAADLATLNLLDRGYSYLSVYQDYVLY